MTRITRMWGRERARRAHPGARRVDSREIAGFELERLTAILRERMACRALNGGPIGVERTQ
ncbi:hypothetical protein PT2222_60325 [Paraburkholderia tropica]